MLDVLRGQITIEEEESLKFKNEGFIVRQSDGSFTPVELQDYSGQKVINYLLAVVRPTPVYVERYHSFEEMQQGSLSNQSFLFGIFEDEEDPLLTQFNVVHKERSNFDFFYTFDKSRALSAYKVNDEFPKSKVLLVRSPLIPVLHPEQRFLFYDYYKYGSLYKFFIDEIIGRVDFFNERTHSLYMAKQKPLVILVCDLYYEKRGPQIQSNIESFARVASSIKSSKVAFTIARSFEIPYSEKLPYFFLKDMVAIYERRISQDPEIFLPPLFYVLKHQALIHQNKVNEESLSQFIKDYLKGKQKPYYKSEPLDTYQKENNADPAVRLIVGEQFDSVIKDQNRDVMIFVFAPWCHISKALHSVWSSLAHNLGDETSIEFVKINGELNEFDQTYQVIGYPTILLAKRQYKRRPIRFTGIPNQENIHKFLLQNVEYLQSANTSGDL